MSKPVQYLTVEDIEEMKKTLILYREHLIHEQNYVNATQPERRGLLRDFDGERYEVDSLKSLGDELNMREDNFISWVERAIKGLNNLCNAFACDTERMPFPLDIPEFTPESPVASEDES